MKSPSESNHVMSTNGKDTYLLIIMLITALFTPNTILLHRAVARNSGPCALNLLWGPSKSRSVGGGGV